jgi:fatty-acyl-CoA synthase
MSHRWVDTLLRKMPQVKISQTVGVPHDTLGELVVSCIVAHDGAALSEDEVKHFAKKQLASFKVPRKVLFFAEDELETTGTNKIKTADLRKLAAEILGCAACTGNCQCQGALLCSLG